MQSALAFQGFVSNAPYLNKLVKPGLGLYNDFANDLSRKTDIEQQLVDAICLRVDDAPRTTGIGGYTSDHKPGLVLTGIVSRPYSEDIYAFFDELNVLSNTPQDELDRDFTYLITAVVKTGEDPQGRDGAAGEYTLELRGSGPDLKVAEGSHEYNQVQVLAQNERVVSKESYDQVCVVFSDNIPELIAQTQISGNEFCTDLTRINQ
jgi:hypothetical protein